MPLEDDANQEVEILRPAHGKGAALSVVKTWAVDRTVLAYVQPLDAVAAARLRLDVADVSHLFVFTADPGYTAADRLRWRGVQIRPSGPAVDASAQGVVWQGFGKAIQADNPGVGLA